MMRLFHSIFRVSYHFASTLLTTKGLFIKNVCYFRIYSLSSPIPLIVCIFAYKYIKCMDRLKFLTAPSLPKSRCILWTAPELILNVGIIAIGLCNTSLKTIPDLKIFYYFLFVL